MNYRTEKLALPKISMYVLAKRMMDIVLSAFLLLIFSPVILIISVVLVIDSRGGAFFTHPRVGKNGKHFPIYKFRTMIVREPGDSSITKRDDVRITSPGRFLRNWKLDEIPSLWNVIIGNMSIVGPRPDVPEYVAKYSSRQLGVLSVRPGLTDFATMKYFNEADALSEADEPEDYYERVILPAKLDLALGYIRRRSLLVDIFVIWKTAMIVLRGGHT